MSQKREFLRYKKPLAFNMLFYKQQALVFLILFLFLPSSPVLAQDTNCDEIPLTLQMGGIGNMELFSLLCEEEVYIPIADLFDFLKIKNKLSKKYSSVEGYILNQNDKFVIDAARSEITYRGETFILPPGDLKSNSTNLYLKSTHFGKIFHLEISSSIRNMSMEVIPGFELPSLKLARREKIRENLQHLKRGTIAADTSISREKSFFNLGVADWNLHTTQSTGRPNYNRFQLGLGGLLAGGEFHSLLNYSSNRQLDSRNQFYRWRYVNNENKFLRQTTVGKINPRSISTIYNPVVGVNLTNSPTSLKKSFGSYQLSDYTEPDWTVELYINNVLVDFVQADASGFFSFDVPLMYGSTNIELRYYGPYGEEKIVDRQFNIPFVLLPEKDFEYHASAGYVEDRENSVYAQGRLNYGLTRFISVGGGVEYLSSLQENPLMPFLNAAIRLPKNMLLSGEYAHHVGFKGGFHYNNPSNLRLELKYAKYHEEQEAVRFSYLEERELTLSVPVKLGNFHGTSKLLLRQNLTKTNSYFHSEWFLSARAFGLNFNFSTNAFITENTQPWVYSRLSSSIRMPRGFTFSPQVEYEYNTNTLKSLRGELRRRLFNNGYIRSSYTHNFKMAEFYLNVGITFEFGFSRLGFSGNTSKRETTFVETASGSLLFDPQQKYMNFSNRTSLDRANVKFIAFLDINGNGQRDPMEQQLEGMEVRSSSGGRKEETPDGATIFTGLESYVVHHFTMNADLLNRIAWRVKTKSMNIELNPNQITLVEIPVSVEGEVGGFVLDSTADGLGGIKVQILDEKQRLVKQIISEPDGFFSYLGLKSGEYTAQLDPKQLENLKLESNGPFNFEIYNTEEGDIVDDLEFVVQKISAPGDSQKQP